MTRVLLVEDHQELAETVSEVLRGEGIAADVARDGRAALDRSRVNCYDVIVLDRDLPGVHGDEVCRALVAGGSRARCSCSPPLAASRPGSTGSRRCSAMSPGRRPACFGGADYGPFMDAKTEEVRAAHDVLSELYADRLADALDRMPAERAVLGLFCDLTLAADLGANVGDVGCGTGRLEPHLAAQGLFPRGIDLSPEMIRVARRDHPGFDFDVADLRELPFGDASLAGVVCWYSLMYLAPPGRPAAFRELARVLKPGGYLVTAFKAGDSQVRRGGRSTGLGIEFDVYWLSPGEMERRAIGAGFTTVFWGGRPAEDAEGSPQGYLLAQRT